MNLSPDTEAVLSALNDAVEGGLRKRNDIGSILELGAAANNAESVNAIVRTGTALWKVYRTLRRLQPGDEGYHQMEQEFGRQLNELREHLATIVQPADDDTLQRFDDIYFGMTQGVIRNLVDLGHDLSQIRNMQRSA